MIVFLLALFLFLLVALVLHARTRPRFFRRPVHPEASSHGFTRKKPEWVKKEVIRLKALMPQESCRTIAHTFNSLYERKGETVGKTYVAYTTKRHAAQVLLLRKKLKNRKRRQGPRNLVWGMDNTFLSQDKRSLPVLGILDHGTRGLLALRPLRDRSTIGVLRLLLDAIEKFGRPRFLRTDNEGIFTSLLMSLALWFLGIRHQKTDPYCPWQNGRIERLFWTLKERLYSWWATAGTPDHVQHDLDTFKTWYNHARPHQSLNGITPAMAWAGITTPRFFRAWDGILTGFVAPT